MIAGYDKWSNEDGMVLGVRRRTLRFRYSIPCCGVCYGKNHWLTLQLHSLNENGVVFRTGFYAGTEHLGGSLESGESVSAPQRGFGLG